MSEVSQEESYDIAEFGSGSVVDVIEQHRDTSWIHLNHRLKMFAYDYLGHYNHNKAADHAGIPKEKALHTLRSPLVQAFIQDVIEDRQISSSISQDFVSTMWLSILPKLMGEEEVAMVTASGAAIEERKFFASEAVSALREMGKSTKFYENGSGGVVLNLSVAIDANMSTAEASEHYMKLVKGETL